jgi:hypothetical protein
MPSLPRVYPFLSARLVFHGWISFITRASQNYVCTSKNVKDPSKHVCSSWYLFSSKLQSISKRI